MSGNKTAARSGRLRPTFPCPAPTKEVTPASNVVRCVRVTHGEEGGHGLKCEDRDQDLLLLVHGELSLLQRGRTLLHLRRCPRCRERQEQLSTVSHLLAGVIRDRDPATAPATMARPSMARPGAPVPPAVVRRQLAFSLVIVLAVLVVMAFVGAVRSLVTGDGVVPTMERMKAPDDGCRPDLPNDRCR